MSFNPPFFDANELRSSRSRSGKNADIRNHLLQSKGVIRLLK